MFEGDNGGATARGVSDTEIAVAVPQATTSAADSYLIQLLFDYFNFRYEFYGRRLVPLVVPYSTNDSVTQRATADDITSRNAFAALDVNMGSIAPTPALHQALAHNGVISLIDRNSPYSDDILFDELHPYVWGVGQSIEQIWRATSELVCSALVGRPAVHAGAGLTTATRKFGVIVQTQYSDLVPMPLKHQTLVDQLTACGAEPVVASSRLFTGDEARIAMLNLAQAGVTTVICACHTGPAAAARAAIAAGGYEPELLMPNLVYSMEGFEAFVINNADLAAQAKHVFGIYHTPKLLPYQARPFFGAMMQMNPAFDDVKPSGNSFRALESAYRQLLLLASGIQGAGPTLTPDTLASALMTTQFPNPGAGQAPFWQPSVGFGPGDHTMVDDVALAWWNPMLQTPAVGATGTGSWCFVGAGARFAPGQIPVDADSRFFNPAEPCR